MQPTVIVACDSHEGNAAVTVGNVRLLLTKEQAEQLAFALATWLREDDAESIFTGEVR